MFREWFERRELREGTGEQAASTVLHANNYIANRPMQTGWTRVDPSNQALNLDWSRVSKACHVLANLHPEMAGEFESLAQLWDGIAYEITVVSSRERRGSELSPRATQLAERFFANSKMALQRAGYIS
jgi:hypothetical protein